MLYFYDADHRQSTATENTHLFPLDKNGYLLPLENHARITGLSRLILDDLLAELRRIFSRQLVCIHFINMQVDHTNLVKFSCTAVVSNPRSNFDRVSQYLAAAMVKKHRFIKYFNVILLKPEDVDKDRYLQFLLKVLSARSHGDNLCDHYAGFKPNGEIRFLLPTLGRKVAQARELVHEPNSDHRLVGCNHIIRYLMRSAFELVIEEEACYTREIYTCSRFFAKHFPGQAELMRNVLGYYNQPAVAVTDVIASVIDFSDFLHRTYSLRKQTA